MAMAALADALNARHGVDGVLRFRTGPGDLVFAVIDNARATAEICLHGGQVLRWQPRDQAEPVLWLSARARYAPGTAIRGGIPVCWPWFGAADGAATASATTVSSAASSAAPPAASNVASTALRPVGPPPAPPMAAPAHGFARILPWTPVAAAQRNDGATQLRLSLVDSAATRALWPHAFRLEMQITVGTTLSLVLTTTNTGAAPFAITEALHSYFRVGDVGAIAVEGLDGAGYFDSACQSPASAPQRGAVRFSQEVDRVYASAAGCAIDDPVLRRRIHIAKRGSASTIVWNPWEAKAERFGDLGANPPATPGPDLGWRQMVCVESGNAREAAVVVAPGASHALAVDMHVAADAAGARPGTRNGPRD